MTKPRSSKNR